MATNDPHEKEVYPVLLDLKKKYGGVVHLQTVLNELQEVIISSYDRTVNLRTVKGTWMKRIKASAANLDVQLVEGSSISWSRIEEGLQTKDAEKDPSDILSSTTSSGSSSSSNNSLKTLLSEKDKSAIRDMFDNLDRSKFWILESTKRRAAAENQVPEAVEDKLRRFALDCNYAHLCHSMIIDLDDLNWAEVFTEEELDEMCDFGDPVLRELPAGLNDALAELQEKTSALDAFFFAQQMRCHPIEDPILTWLQLSVMTTARFFLNQSTSYMDTFLESDKLYYLWSFVNSIHQGTSIQAKGKEKSSNANATARNAKRKLSAVEGIDNKKMGRKMDTVYVASDIELGCLEIKGTVDDTKEKEDSRVKMPVVMRDMLLQVVDKMPSMLRKAHIVGYHINGNMISMLDMDVPKGYITRLRRIKELQYPTVSEDYVQRIVPLLQLAAHGQAIMDTTIKQYRQAPMPLTIATGKRSTMLPPCFIPTRSSSTTPSSSSSSSTTPSKKHR